jgi:hypothetical protein
MRRNGQARPRWRYTRRLAEAGATAVLYSLAALAAEPGAELDPVVVEAERRRALVDLQVSEFVHSIVGSAQVESLERWKVPVCPVVVGLADTEADFVEQRIGQVAADAGVPLGEEGCAPNFVVVLSPDPQALLEDWWSEQHDLFNRDRGLGGVNRMIRTDRPVRVWHNACNVPPLRGYYEPGGQLNCGTGVLGTRLVRSSVRAIYSAIMVVDTTAIEGVTFNQLSDYVAMVGLAKIRTDLEIGGAPTILGLFAADDASRSNGMTAWDRSFLKGVYETTDGSVTELAQIKVRMARDLAR